PDVVEAVRSSSRWGPAQFAGLVTTPATGHELDPEVECLVVLRELDHGAVALGRDHWSPDRERVERVVEVALGAGLLRDPGSGLGERMGHDIDVVEAAGHERIGGTVAGHPDLIELPQRLGHRDR